MRLRGVVRYAVAIAVLTSCTVMGASAAPTTVPIVSIPIAPLDNMSISLPNLQWPAIGEGAVYVPQLHLFASHRNTTVPVASLTKMMTAYVVLQHLPLQEGQSGPCVTLTSFDVTYFHEMVASDQSSVAVAVGEHLCENQLVDGLLVHSASNYAELLAVMVAGSIPAFVTMMNHDAATLGLMGTHFADVSGFSPYSVSTASDLATLAGVVMADPVIATDVDQTSTTLPVAGVVTSYTPYVGSYGVVGVKSGRTSAAGGCDVMAMQTHYAGVPVTVYSVVLGQRGGDLLTPAGNAALALARSATKGSATYSLAQGAVVGVVRWGSRSTKLLLGEPLELSAAWGPNGTLTHPVFSVVQEQATPFIQQDQAVAILSMQVGNQVVAAPVNAQTGIGPTGR